MKSLFALAFLAALAVFSPLVAYKATRTPVREIAKKFPLKRWFVELNGGAHRAIGRRYCNTVYRTPDGVLLSELKGKGRTEPLAEATAGFARWLAGKNASFIYVQTPSKIDMAGAMLPAPLVNRGNARADALLARLAGMGVRTVDLRAMLTATPDDVERYFYRTDHHWNNDAVFKAFGVLAPEIARAAGRDPNLAAAAPDSWTCEVWPRCFTGTKTRRTGCLFGGMDDLAVYEPRFATDMEMEVLSKGLHFSGDFRATVMWHSDKIRKWGADCFGKDAYSHLYIGGTYGVVRHANRLAPLKLRLMIVGDSFARPLEAFLSTVVTDLIALDQRRFAPGETVAGFVESFKPDLVLQMNNPSAFGAEKWVEDALDSVLGGSFQDFEIIAVDDGSTDATGAILDRLAAADPRVRAIHQENRGLSGARNSGLDAARGEYVFFLDADDTFNADFLALGVEEMSATGADYCIFPMLVTEIGASAPRLEPLADDYRCGTPEEIRSRLVPRFIGYSMEHVRRWYAGEPLFGNREPGCVCRCVFRRELIEKHRVRFDERITLYEDALFQCDYLLRARKTTCRPEPVYNYVLHDGGLIATRNSLARVFKNKLALLRVRQALDAREGGTLRGLYAASCVLALLEMFAMLRTLRIGLAEGLRTVREIASDPEVRAALREFPLSPRRPALALAVLAVRAFGAAFVYVCAWTLLAPFRRLAPSPSA